jgi:hypothetical protein
VAPPVIPATQEAEISSKSAQANSSTRPYLKKPFTKIGLVEWLNVKAMSLSPSTKKREKTTKTLVLILVSFH